MSKDLSPAFLAALADLPVAFREGLALHMIFERLGFRPDDIYVRPQRPKFFMTVKRGGLEFNAEAGKYDHGLDVLIPAWKKTTEWFNTLSQDERYEIREGSKVRLGVVSLVTALIAHGFNLQEFDA